MTTLERPAWAEIDLAALAHNVHAMRRLIGPGVKLYAVCKGDAYGVGIGPFAACVAAAGADALATNDPEDVARVREAGVTLPILLYPCLPAASVAEMAALDVILSAYDMETVAALAALGRTTRVFVKADCGFGRLGLGPDEWDRAFQTLARAQQVQVVGVYTHLGPTDRRESLDPQLALFRRAVAAARAAGFDDLQVMAASSQVAVSHPDLHFNAVDTGRALYGIVEPPWAEKIATRPVIAAVKGRVLQVRTLPAGAPMGIARIGRLDKARRTAVVSCGFANGFPRLPEAGHVLVRGRRAPVVGLRSTEHTVIDVTGIDGVAGGDEAVFLGRQGDEEISFGEISQAAAVPMIELVPRIGRASYRVYRR